MFDCKKIMKIIIHLVLVLTLFLSSLILPKNIIASEVVFEDDFSSLNGDKWQIERNGDLWSFNEGFAQAEVVNPSTISEISVKNNLWPDELTEYDYLLDFTPISGADKNISFGFENTENWYEVHFNNEGYQFVKLTGNIVTFSKSGSETLSNDQTHHFLIKLRAEKISIFLNDSLLFEEASPEFINFGKISLKAGTGAVFPTKVRFDNIIVKSVDADLPVPLFKQTDPTWGNEEYGLRTTSSPDFASIAELGCAMTSAAMIMNYHGITQMPDGSPVNPSTLNTWLKGNNGYAGKYIIFPVIGRLTQQISSVYGTPKLEYNRVGGSSWDPARDQITAHNPAVMQVQGHFLVAKGNRDSGDLGINDPFYSFETLMPHTALPVISTRTFTPSYTDLSAISVHAYAPATIQLFKDGELDDQAQNYSEALLNQTTGEEETSMSVIEHMKPPSGEYAVAATTSEGLTPVELYITTMTVDGQTVQEVIEGYTNPEGELLLSFSFDSSQPSEIKRASSWSSLTNDLSVLYDQDKIQKKSIVRGLSHYITAVSTMSLSKQLQHAPIIRYIINHFSDQIDPTALLYLNQELDAIANNLE